MYAQTTCTTLGPDECAFINDLLLNGTYRSTSEVLRTALQFFMEDMKAKRAIRCSICSSVERGYLQFANREFSELGDHQLVEHAFNDARARSVGLGKVIYTCQADHKLHNLKNWIVSQLDHTEVEGYPQEFIARVRDIAAEIGDAGINCDSLLSNDLSHSMLTAYFVNPVYVVVRPFGSFLVVIDIFRGDFDLSQMVTEISVPQDAAQNQVRLEHE